MAGTSEETDTCSIGNFKLGLSELKLLLLMKISILICLGGFELEKSINLVFAGWIDIYESEQSRLFFGILC